MLTDGQTLASVGVRTDEMLEARVGMPAAPVARPQPAAAVPASSAVSQRSSNGLGIPDSIITDPVRVRDYIRSNQRLLFEIETQNPSLAQALMSPDISPFAAMWEPIAHNLEQQRRAEQERFRLANADPMDPEVQARIAEEIRLKNVQGSLTTITHTQPHTSGMTMRSSQPWALLIVSL